MEQPIKFLAQNSQLVFTIWNKFLIGKNNHHVAHPREYHILSSVYTSRKRKTQFTNANATANQKH